MPPVVISDHHYDARSHYCEENGELFRGATVEVVESWYQLHFHRHLGMLEDVPFSGSLTCKQS